MSVVEYTEEDMERIRVRLYRRVAERRQRHRCFYCLCFLTSVNTTADHTTPRARGGTTTYENIIAACQRCNRVRRSTSFDEFVAMVRDPTPNDSLAVWMIAFERRMWERTWNACDRIGAQVGMGQSEVDAIFLS